MNPEAQRIAIAEAPTPDAILGDWRDEIGGSRHLPDYLNDLNAMADARKSLTSDQQEEFIYQLSLICCPITGETWEMVDSSAGQQAETLLKTLGLWVEEDAQ